MTFETGALDDTVGAFRDPFAGTLETVSKVHETTHTTIHCVYRTHATKDIGRLHMQTALGASPYRFAGWTDRAEAWMPEASAQDLMCSVEELSDQRRPSCEVATTEGCVVYSMQDHTWVHHNVGQSDMCREGKETSPLCTRKPTKCTLFAKTLHGASEPDVSAPSEHEVGAAACVAYTLAHKSFADEMSKKMEAIATAAKGRTQDQLFEVYEFCTRYCQPNRSLPRRYQMAGAMRYNPDTKSMEPTWFRCMPLCWKNQAASPGHFCDKFMSAFCKGTLDECPTSIHEEENVPVMCGTSTILRKGGSCATHTLENNCISDSVCDFDKSSGKCKFICAYDNEAACNRNASCTWVQIWPIMQPRRAPVATCSRLA